MYNQEPTKLTLQMENSSFLKQSVPHNDFIMWENNSNMCWLDASLALLVHNHTMRSIIEQKPECHVSKIIKNYDEAINILNYNESGKSIEERLQIAKSILQAIQESSFEYLQPIVKCKKGDPDSAFCSLLNLLKEDKMIQTFFNISFAWERQCENCGTKRFRSPLKPIITICNIKKFVPENHISPWICHSCKKKDQTMKLIYEKLPGCLIFHFEQGAGIGDSPPLLFNIACREYQLTGVVILEKNKETNVDHFVTYIRNPSSEKWLECNDLNLDITSFTPGLPTFNLKDVYIYVYEAFDSLGTIELIDSSLLFTSDLNIPCIDISGESDDDNEIEKHIDNKSTFLSLSVASTETERNLLQSKCPRNEIKISSGSEFTNKANATGKIPVSIVNTKPEIKCDPGPGVYHFGFNEQILRLKKKFSPHRISKQNISVTKCSNLIPANSDPFSTDVKEKTVNACTQIKLTNKTEGKMLEEDLVDKNMPKQTPVKESAKNYSNKINENASQPATLNVAKSDNRTQEISISSSKTAATGGIKKCINKAPKSTNSCRSNCNTKLNKHGVTNSKFQKSTHILSNNRICRIRGKKYLNQTIQKTARDLNKKIINVNDDQEQCLETCSEYSHKPRKQICPEIGIEGESKSNSSIKYEGKVNSFFQKSEEQVSESPFHSSVCNYTVVKNNGESEAHANQFSEQQNVVSFQDTNRNPEMNKRVVNEYEMERCIQAEITNTCHSQERNDSESANFASCEEHGCKKTDCDCKLLSQDEVVDIIVDYHMARLCEIFNFPLNF